MNQKDIMILGTAGVALVGVVLYMRSRSSSATSAPSGSQTYVPPGNSGGQTSPTQTTYPTQPYTPYSPPTQTPTPPINGPYPVALAGTAPSYDDPGFIVNGQWYPNISSIPASLQSSAQSASSVSNYYQQFVGPAQVPTQAGGGTPTPTAPTSNPPTSVGSPSIPAPYPSGNYPTILAYFNGRPFAAIEGPGYTTFLLYTILNLKGVSYTFLGNGLFRLSNGNYIRGIPANNTTYIPYYDVPGIAVSFSGGHPYFT